MEETWTGFNAFLAARGIDPRDCWLYRHAGSALKDAQKRWSEGRDRFLSFTTSQSRHTAERLASRRYIAHFMAENVAGQRDHRGRFLGITRRVGNPQPFDYRELSIVPGYIPKEAFPPNTDAERFAIGMEWAAERRFDAFAGRLQIDWGNAPVAFLQMADNNEKSVYGVLEEIKGEDLHITVLEAGSFDETKKFRVHFYYETRCFPAEVVKAERGLVCEGCDLDAVALFGADHASRVIEAHHRTPRSEIEESGRLVTTDDFFALCANCHRLIHGLDTLDDLGPLKKLLERRRS